MNPLRTRFKWSMLTIGVLVLLGASFMGTNIILGRVAPVVEDQETADARQIDEEVLSTDVSITRSLKDIVGSGVIFEQNDKVAHIITCFHVIADLKGHCDVYQTRNGQELITSGTVIYTNPATDLAVVETSAVWAHGAKICDWNDSSTLQPGRRLMIVGHPLGIDDAHPTEGMIASVSCPENLMQMSAPVYYGNSGGGVFAKFNGHWKLIGIASRVAQHRGETVCHVSFSCTTNQLLAFLEFYKANK